MFLSECRGLKPPPKLLPSEWSEKFRMLPSEDSAEPGRYRCSRAPYQRGIMDAIARYQEVVVMTSAQIGKTVMQLNSLGYLIHYQPCPILWVAPTIEMAEATSNDRIATMVRDTKPLAELLPPTKTRSKNNRILYKKFPGGHLTLAGANSPASLASRPVRALFLDEVDRYPSSAGDEGDPVDIAKKRTTAFWNRLILMVSTPTIKGASRIERAFENSNQSYFEVPCPHCGHRQFLRWENLSYENKGTPKFKLGPRDLLGYICDSCGTLIEESYKTQIIAQGDWVAKFPDRAIAGFHLNELYSPFKSWRDVALEYEAAKDDPRSYQVWFNTSLGLPIELEERTAYDANLLGQRAELSDYVKGEIPEGVLLMTAGVDVQGDRLECAVWGWGEGEQAWVIDYQVFFGDPAQDGVWQILDDFLEKTYPHPLGGQIRVALAGIDSGYLSESVYAQVLKRRGKWSAFKGKSGDRRLVGTPQNAGISKRGKPLKRGVKVFTVGVDSGKSVLLNRARIAEPGPKYLNLPRDIGENWIAQFANSEILVKKFKNGRPNFVWERLPNVRNEGLDTAVYAYAAASMLGITSYGWEKAKRRVTVVPVEKVEILPDTQEPETPKRPKRRSPSGYLAGYGRL